MQTILPYFSQNPLDRLEHKRASKESFNELKNSPQSKIILYHETQIILDDKHNCFFSKEILELYEDNLLVLLGVDSEFTYFALHVKEIPQNCSSINLRDLAEEDLLSQEKLGILAQALSVLNWHISHGHCSSCGEKTLVAHAGWRRDCPACKKEHFPRTDPVVIMLVTYGEYCLLGRGVNFPPHRYSCLAGYMEGGESIEDAARRELFEEAGIKGGEVSYIASQPWPFPASLMIGVHVKALNRELCIDTNEISDAKWLHKNEIKALLDGDESLGISTPRSMAIARNLLEWWVLQG